MGQAKLNKNSRDQLLATIGEAVKVTRMVLAKIRPSSAAGGDCFYRAAALCEELQARGVDARLAGGSRHARGTGAG